MVQTLSKTGDELITIEIKQSRQQEAMANVEAAGLTDFVDFKLEDAHQIVKDLDGPFVFSGADKNWCL